MRCEECRDNLAEYSLDALDDAQAVSMREHLLACVDCRAELAAFERLDELLTPVEEARPETNLWAGVSARIAPRQSVAPRWWSLHWQPALAAAAVLVMLVMGGLMMSAKTPVLTAGSTMLAADYQEQQVIAEWSQPLADDASLGLMLASIDLGEGELQ